MPNVAGLAPCGRWRWSQVDGRDQHALCGHELSLDLGSGELVQRLGVLTFSWT